MASDKPVDGKRDGGSKLRAQDKITAQSLKLGDAYGSLEKMVAKLTARFKENLGLQQDELYLIQENERYRIRYQDALKKIARAGGTAAELARRELDILDEQVDTLRRRKTLDQSILDVIRAQTESLVDQVKAGDASKSIQQRVTSVFQQQGSQIKGNLSILTSSLSTVESAVRVLQQELSDTEHLEDILTLQTKISQQQKLAKDEGRISHLENLETERVGLYQQIQEEAKKIGLTIDTTGRSEQEVTEEILKQLKARELTLRMEQRELRYAADVLKIVKQKTNAIYQGFERWKGLAMFIPGIGSAATRMMDNLRDATIGVVEELGEGMVAGKGMKETVVAAFKRFSLEIGKVIHSGGILRGTLLTLGGVLSTALVGVGFGIYKVFGLAYEEFTKIVNASKELSQTTGISMAHAYELGQATREAFRSTANQLSTYEEINKVQTAMINEFGRYMTMPAKFSAQLSDTAKHFGYNQEEAGKLHATLTELGASDELAVKIQTVGAGLAEANKLAPGIITKDLLENQDTLAKNFAGMPKAAQKTAIEVRKMGYSLKIAAKVQDHLFQVEQSLTAQMEASVGLNRMVDVSKARQLGLDGDMVGMMKELTTQIGTYEQFTRMSVPQRILAARAAGMEVSELQKGLYLQKFKYNFTEDELKLISEREDIYNNIEKYDAESLRIKLNEAQAQEKLNVEFEKAKSLIAAGLLPAVQTIAAIIVKLAPAISWFAEKIGKVLGLFGGIKSLADVMGLSESVTGAEDSLQGLDAIIGAKNKVVQLNRDIINSEMGITDAVKKTASGVADTVKTAIGGKLPRSQDPTNGGVQEVIDALGKVPTPKVSLPDPFKTALEQQKARMNQATDIMAGGAAKFSDKYKSPAPGLGFIGTGQGVPNLSTVEGLKAAQTQMGKEPIKYPIDKEGITKALIDTGKEINKGYEKVLQPQPFDKNVPIPFLKDAAVSPESRKKVTPVDTLIQSVTPPSSQQPLTTAIDTLTKSVQTNSNAIQKQVQPSDAPTGKINLVSNETPIEELLKTFKQYEEQGLFTQKQLDKLTKAPKDLESRKAALVEIINEVNKGNQGLMKMGSLLGDMSGLTKGFGDMLGKAFYAVMGINVAWLGLSKLLPLLTKGVAGFFAPLVTGGKLIGTIAGHIKGTPSAEGATGEKKSLGGKLMDVIRGGGAGKKSDTDRIVDAIYECCCGRGGRGQRTATPTDSTGGRRTTTSSDTGKKGMFSKVVEKAKSIGGTVAGFAGSLLGFDLPIGSQTTPEPSEQGGRRGRGRRGAPAGGTAAGGGAGILSSLGSGLAGFLQALAPALSALGTGPAPIGAAVVAGLILSIGAAMRLAAPAIKDLAPVLIEALKQIAPTLEQVGGMIANVFTGIGTVIQSIGMAIATPILAVGQAVKMLASSDAKNLWGVGAGIARVGFGIRKLNNATEDADFNTINQLVNALMPLSQIPDIGSLSSLMTGINSVKKESFTIISTGIKEIVNSLATLTDEDLLKLESLKQAFQPMASVVTETAGLVNTFKLGVSSIDIGGFSIMSQGILMVGEALRKIDIKRLESLAQLAGMTFVSPPTPKIKSPEDKAVKPAQPTIANTTVTAIEPTVNQVNPLDQISGQIRGMLPAPGGTSDMGSNARLEGELRTVANLLRAYLMSPPSIAIQFDDGTVKTLSSQIRRATK